MLRKVLSLIIFCISTGLFAQKPVKEFFNNEWKQCDSSIATYYRMVTYDDKGSPVGIVRDYFISGELQWEGRFSFFDKYDSYNSKHQGECIWYYKNGKKQTSSFYQNGVLSGHSTGWYENGTRSYECTYKKGQLDGMYVGWFESGLLQSYAYYKDGEIVGVDSYNCDEFGECGSTEKYDFFPPKPTKGNKKSMNTNAFFDFNNTYGSDNGYFTGVADVTDFTASPSEKIKTTYKGEGMVLTANKEGGIKKLFKPLDYTKLLVITTKIAHIKGDSKSKSGLVFAYADEKNYHSFLVDKEGNYEVGQYIEGNYTELSKGTASATSDYDYNYFDYNSNGKNKKAGNETYYELFLMSYKDTVQLFVGYTPVYKTASFKGSGNFIGYQVAPNSAVKVKELAITKSIEAPFVSADIDTKTMKNKAWKSTGSGFVVSTDGYIVTNHHVVDGANEMEVDLIREGNVVSYKCDVILKDEKSDLAVIKINDPTFKNFKAIPYTIQTRLEEVGTNVYALGYPFAMSTLGNELKYTEGSINARTGMDGNILAYQVSAPVQPGNSGGPLLDYDGNIIGVINSKLFYADNVAFAVKANYILNLLYLLPQYPDYPAATTLKGKSPADQVNIMREYVPLIKVR
jgi:S1-C subfamily serine protease